MGKYDEDFYKITSDDKEEPVDPILFFLYKISNELAEGNRLTRQKLTMPEGDFLSIENNLDKA